MFVSINHLDVPVDKSTEVAERFDVVKTHLHSVPGFQRFRLLRPHLDGKPWLVYTEWDSRTYYDGWRNSPMFGRMHPHHEADGHGDNLHATLSIGAEVIPYEVLSDLSR
jgi:heme-degrading monooxygenase HmoA